tara:strand:+ start:205 stop:1011 length:807 start_codon:yes stop_codon:yes gene_type:complete
MNEAEFIEENTEEGTAPEVAEVAEQEAPQLNETEQTAYDQGWRPEEDFEGKEGNWKTAKEYIKDGEFIGKINDLNRRMDAQENDFNQRNENNNKLHEARRKSDIEDLKKAQREAVNSADEELYDKAQAKLDSLEAEANKTSPGKDPAITAWEAKNAWINDPNDEKAAIAQGIWNNYANQNPNSTAQQALEHVDARLGKLYPVNNPRRDQPDSNETPVRKPRQNNKDLTMNDLSPKEQSEWAQLGPTGAGIFKDQKSFFKAVKDTRVKS